MASGANQQQAMDAAYYVAQKHIKAGKNFEIAGQEITKEDLVDPATFYAKYQEAIDNAQWTKVGETIGSEIVKALQGAHFMESMTDSGVMNKELYASKNDVNGNGISESAIAAVWKEAQENQRAAFDKLNPEQQVQATNTLVEKLDALDLEPDEIAKAVAAATGKDTNENTIKGEDGNYTIDWTSTAGLQSLSESVKTTVKDSATKGVQGLKGDAEVNITKITGMFGNIAPNYPGATSINNNASGQNGSRGGYTIPGRPTLTGEEGEELVWEPKQNAAYMVGSNGPQFANISRDAVVWNADQTKRIKKNSGSVGRFGTGAKGIHNFGTMRGGNAGKGSGAGAGGLVIPATADIQEATPPKKEPTIPVNAELQVKGAEGQGLGAKIKALFGKGKGGPSVDVAARVTKLNPVKAGTLGPVGIVGEITKTVLKNKKAVKGIKATATVTKVRKAGTVQGEPVKVQAKATVGSVDPSGAQGAINNLQSSASSSQTMTVGADTSAAEAKVNALISKFNKT